MLNEIGLVNFKAFQFTQAKLAGLNLFTGINGLGKSSVIQALLLLRQSYSKGLFPSKGILLNGDIVKLGKGSDVLSIHSETKEIFFEITLDNNLSKIALGYIQDSDFLPFIANNSFISETFFEQPLFDSRFKYLNAERISPKFVYDVSLFEVEKNKSLGIHGENTSLFISRYQRDSVKIIHALHPSASSDSLIDQISAWLKEISPGVSINSRYFPDIESAKFTYQYEYEKILTPEFSPTNVGFGLTYALPVITSILSSQPNDLLIIENPESHLHPAGQSKLGELLFKAAISGVQIIVETHSDHVLNGIRVAIHKQNGYSELVKILYFERDMNSKKHTSRIVYPSVNDQGQIDNWPSGFFDQSVNDLNFLLGL